MESILNIALHYKNVLGFNVIPMKITWNPKKVKNGNVGSYEKKPIISWEEYQSRKVTNQEITEWWTKYPDAGIGMVTGSISGGVIGIDCDSEIAEKEMEENLPDNLSPPCAKSISGCKHYYFKSESIYHKKVKFFNDIDLQAENSLIVLPPSRGRNGDSYSWIIEPRHSGDFPSPHIINNESILYKELCKLQNYAYNESSLHCLTNLTNTYIDDIWKEGTRDDNLYRVCLALRKAGNQEDYLRQVLRAIVASWGEVDEKWINDKIKSVLKREEKVKRNLHQEIKEYILTQKSLQEPCILLTDTLQTLQLLTKEDKNNAYVVINRICSEKNLIEKQTDKRGLYKIIYAENDQEIDYLTADTKPLDIKFPLQAHEFFQVHKGNIVIIAGESNAGKTAYMLNLAYKNKDKIGTKVNYMSSEMQDGTELRIRLDEFDFPISTWKSVRFTFRTDNFPEKIIPDAINIIDYLDEGKDAEAYKMAGRIRDIADKLTTGIAIIAIQKDPNKQFGFGGAGTLNRARVYITLQKTGLLKIEKAKIWRNKTINPNGMGIKFKLVGGAKFIQATDWLTPEEIKVHESLSGNGYGKK